MIYFCYIYFICIVMVLSLASLLGGLQEVEKVWLKRRGLFYEHFLTIYISAGKPALMYTS